MLSDRHPSRRIFTLQALALTGTAAFVAACGKSATNNKSDTAGTADDGGDTADSANDTADTGGDTDATAAGDWATGGTASMSGTYDDPFTSAAADCALTCAMTLGPCYGETMERQDISEGVDGLPVRLALRIVDDNCAPVAGAVVDIWHAAPNGLYSGRDTDEMCTNGNAAALAGRWFRGYGTTDTNGRVDFDTCFPGWYTSRAIHIHFQVRKTKEYATAQLFFTQKLINEVFTTEPIYEARGVPDVPNASDKVLADNDPAMYTLDTAQLPDGAMMAFKTIVIRASLAEELCVAPEADGGGPR